MTIRGCLLAFACALLAAGGIATFIASLEVRTESLGRSPLALSGGRYR